MPILTVTVTDVDMGRGVPRTGVYLFSGGGPVEPPENADLSGTTDATGSVKFTASGFFNVGIIAKGYEAADPNVAPPEAWKDTWTCWGACGVSRDLTYDFQVKRTRLIGSILARLLEAFPILKSFPLIRRIP